MLLVSQQPRLFWNIAVSNGLLEMQIGKIGKLKILCKLNDLSYSEIPIAHLTNTLYCQSWWKYNLKQILSFFALKLTIDVFICLFMIYFCYLSIYLSIFLFICFTGCIIKDGLCFKMRWEILALHISSSALTLKKSHPFKVATNGAFCLSYPYMYVFCKQRLKMTSLFPYKR